MQQDQHTLQSGQLPVGDGHKIWYMEWGCKHAAVPVFVIHGGPGSGSSESSKTMFDPRKHRVVFFDQRGCGKSTPQLKLKENNTDKLAKDIEILRRHIGDDKIMLAGGSWGSTLALVYAIRYRSHVHKLLLNGIFLGTAGELNYLHQGELKRHFPEAWYQYDEVVPTGDKGDTIAYYYRVLVNGSGQKRDDHVKRWALLQSGASSIDDDYLKDELQIDGSDEKLQQMAMMEAHYFVNKCFLPENYILANALKLSNIPTVLVHGRHDHICPPESAQKLAGAMGENCRLHIVPGSHRKEMAVREVVRAYAWSFLA